MVVPTYGRSRAELEAPFAASGAFAGLSVRSLEVFRAEDHIWMDSGFGRDAGRFRRELGRLFARLDLPDAGGRARGRCGAVPRAAGFMAALEAAMARRLAAAPEESVIPLAAMVLEKAPG